MNEGCRSWLWRGLLLFGVVVLPLCLIIWGIFLALTNFKASCGMNFGLSPEDAQRVAELGYDPQMVAAAAASNQWCSGAFGQNVDIGILMAIFLSETQKGTTYGTYHHHPADGTTARWLLDRWEEEDIRSSNPVAAQYIDPDYNGYTGHRAGEMGPGFMPYTWKAMCERYLAQDGDREIASCDVWNPKVFMRGIGARIASCEPGYSAELPPEVKFTTLWCWNRQVAYRWGLLDYADAINEDIGFVTPIASSSSSPETPIALGIGPSNDLAVLAYILLQPLGLFPPAEPWLDTATPGRFDITQDWKDTIYTDSLGHTGIDQDCETGDPVVAVGSGKVVVPNPSTLMGRLSAWNNPRGFGRNVWIEHPNGYSTISAHLDQVFVSKGQSVSIGQRIGTCGETGNAEGDHLHFGVSDIHPDEFTGYHQWAPSGWVNPHLVLGQCVGTVRH